MHRDMDLVRKILMGMAKHQSGFAPDDFTVPGYDQDVIGHHIWLMEQGGLVTAVDVTAQGDPSPTALPGAVTWKGHDFLETVRTDKVWLKVKAQLKDRGVSLPFALIQELALKIAAKYAGIGD